jgi:hypothetical protein
MCTVTFSPRRRGYALAMNRDEKLTRVAGLPPAEKIIQGCAVLAPSEPGGGTWLALNDSGVTFALINWYAVTARVRARSASRGQVVNTVSTARTPELAASKLAELPLKRINPFRLIGIFPAANGIVEWRWNLKRLVCQKRPWKIQQWISSGFDEPAAQHVRHRIFRNALTQKSARSLDWLRRLHRSHSPHPGPFSICMHRADAATVSFSEVMVLANQAVMRHQAGAPCHSGKVSIYHFRIPKKQNSLKTRDAETARRICQAKNEALRQPAINLQARPHLPRTLRPRGPEA